MRQILLTLAVAAAGAVPALAQDNPVAETPLDCSDPANAAAEECVNLEELEGVTNFAPLVGAGVGLLGIAALAGDDGGSSDGTTGTTSTVSTIGTN